MFVKIFIPILLSFAITAVLGPILIPFLRKLKVGQTEREELEQAHRLGAELIETTGSLKPPLRP